jgi:hypothetical protein
LQKIFKLRGNKESKTIPTLKKESVNYETDVSKAILFANIFKTTFSDSNDKKYDSRFKEKLRNFWIIVILQGMYS